MTENKDTPSVVSVELMPEIRLSADWSEFAGGLSAAATDFFMKGAPDGAASGIGALVKFLASVRMDPNPAQRAWALAVLSFAWSMDQISKTENFDPEHLKAALRAGIDEAKAVITSDPLMIPSNFFQHPTSIPVYRTIIRRVIEYLVSANKISDPIEFNYKMDAAFNRAIYEIWSRKPDFYQPVMDTISNPGEPAANMALSWSRYRAKLVYDFGVRPLFGQEEGKIAISQLYVPLRCLWVKEKQSRASYHYASGPTSESHEVAMLDHVLSTWLGDPDPADWLRLIGGGPGSGKSTTLKALASRTAKMSQWRPLFIPLQHIGLERDLRESINSYFAESTDSAFTSAPLARSAVEDGPPLLLIFDGLDELVAPGEAAKEVVGLFANRLNSLVSTLTGSGNRLIKVVVSGRMPSFQAAEKYLTPPLHGCLEVHGFLPVNEHADSDNDLWTSDQRPQWWSQWAKLKNEPLDTPAAFSAARLAGITHEPLLCYLLALAGYATDHWEQAAENRNRIYSALVDSIYDRGWGEGSPKRHGPGRHMSKSDFNKLMETIALAAWLGGDTKVATVDNFELALDITEAREAWSAFTEDNGDDVTNLALNFYLKSSEVSQRGFEFTHKSFGEYLASRSILAISDEVATQADRRPDYALQDWFKATGTGIFTPEMLHFIRDEARLKVGSTVEKENARSKKIEFQSLAMRAAADGFPVNLNPGGLTRTQFEQANAETCLWVIINSISLAFRSISEDDNAKIVMHWTSPTHLSSIIHRILHNSPTSIIARCLDNIVADKQEISNINSGAIEMSFSSLRGTLFMGMSISDIDLTKSDLSKARFYQCTVRQASFNSACLDGMTIHASHFYDCYYENSSGTVVVSPASLTLMPLEDINALGDRYSIMLPTEEYRNDIIDFLEKKLRIIRACPAFLTKELVQDLTDRISYLDEYSEGELTD